MALKPHRGTWARAVVVATTDPASLPPKATWYPATKLPHPDAPHASTGPHPPADLAEIVRLYGLRPWIEQTSSHHRTAQALLTAHG